MYDRINLMLPTFNRSDTKLPAFIDSAMNQAADLKNICFTFCVNKRDTKTQEYLVERFKDHPEMYHILIEDLIAPHLAKFFNQLYTDTKFKDAGTVVTMLGDDMEFQTGGYDLVILQTMNECDGLGLVYGDDCLWWHEKLCVNIFTSRKYIDLFLPLPFMCELFPRDQIDIVHYEIAQQLGMCYYLSSLKIFHNHAMRAENMKDGVCVDETFLRLLKEDKIVDSNINLREEYIISCIENLKNNSKSDLRYSVDVLMTTYNRANLLTETVESYLAAAIYPHAIYVFDDASDAPGEIKKICERLPGMVWHSNTENLGCIKNTPAALGYMFGTVGSEAVVIIDSDVQFDKMWWPKLNSTYVKVKHDADFGSVNMLNLPDNPPGTKSNRIYGILEKAHWGACGALITYDFFKNYVEPNKNTKHGLWDNYSSHAAHDDGKKNYVISPSLIQHTGITAGTNLGGPGTYATDFRGYRWPNKDAAINNNVKDKSVLFNVQGRYGDIIMASMVANMLKEKDYKITWSTIPYYTDMLSVVDPTARKLTRTEHLQYPNFPWGDLDTEQLRNIYPDRFRYYINAQPGSRENHDMLLQSGLHIAVFIKKRVEEIINEPLPNNFIDYLCPFKDAPIVPPDMEDRPLCIIAPEVISVESAFGGNDHIDELYEEYSKDYFVQVITKEPPNDRIWKELRGRYLYNMTFMECMRLLMSAKLFIGNDSGLAWAALYNRDCKKIIYHKVERLLQTNAWYNFIDPLAEDKVVS